MHLAAALKPRAILLPLVHNLFMGSLFVARLGRMCVFNDGERVLWRCSSAMPSQYRRPAIPTSIAFLLQPNRAWKLPTKLISPGAL